MIQRHRIKTSLRPVASTGTNQGSANLSSRSKAPVTDRNNTSIARTPYAIDSPLLKASFRLSHRKRSRHSSLPSHEGIDATTYAIAYVCHRSRLDRTQASNGPYANSNVRYDRSFRHSDSSLRRTNDLVTEEAVNPHIDHHHTSEGTPTDGSIY